MFRKEKSTPVKGCEEVIKKHKEYLDQIDFKDETERAVFAIRLELEEMPNSMLVRIGCSMNLWKWPDELPGKPDGWEDMSTDDKFIWTNPICRYIEISVGRKALLRYSHTVEGNSTDQEFDDWWDSHHLKESEGDIRCGFDNSSGINTLVYIPSLAMSIAAIIISIVQLLR